MPVHWRLPAKLSTLALVLTGCNAPAYFDGFERLVIDADVLAAGEETAHPELGVFVQSEYWLDFENPTAADLEELQPAGATPAEMIPWVRRDDLEISVHWRLVNDSDQFLRNVYVTLDGATEFYDFNPIATYGAAGGEEAEEPVIPSLFGFTPRTLSPGEVLEGEFREDDVTEAMFDLDAISRYCAGAFAMLYNRSEANPIGTDVIPDDAVMAGMVMLRLTVGAPGPVTLDYSIRVRDRAGILFDSRVDEQRFAPMPELFVPALATAGTGDAAGPCATGEAP